MKGMQIMAANAIFVLEQTVVTFKPFNRLSQTLSCLGVKGKPK